MTLTFRTAFAVTLLVMEAGLSSAVRAQGSPPASPGSTLFQNVRIFDGKSGSLSATFGASALEPPHASEVNPRRANATDAT